MKVKLYLDKIDRHNVDKVVATFRAYFSKSELQQLMFSGKNTFVWELEVDEFIPANEGKKEKKGGK